MEWETQVYEDEDISFEIPASWHRHETSSEDMHLILFTEQEPAAELPYNVCIQILSLQNRSKDFHYADPKIQKSYYAFLTSPDSGLTEAAQDLEYWTERIGDTWVDSIRFVREVDDSTMVQQTGYFPMGLDYSLAIWATDYQDSCTPPVEEIAQHICETLHVRKP